MGNYYLSHPLLTHAALRERFALKKLNYIGSVGLDVRLDHKRFKDWLMEGRHGDMAYLADLAAQRLDPDSVLDGAQSAILFGLEYRQPILDVPVDTPKIAQYARLKDYHKVMRNEASEVLNALLADVQQSLGRTFAGRVLVDTAPVLERALFAKAGRGFIGKNTCYIDTHVGSFMLLGEILTSVPLEHFEASRAEPLESQCGSCKRCQTHCPTGALDKDYVIDARKCLAYWTIEHRGEVPEEFWPHFRLYWFGCDICQLVCPFNRESHPIREQRSETFARLELVKFKTPPDLLDVATMDQAAYERMFGGTPMTRAKLQGLKRNALIALCETRDSRLPQALDHARKSGDDVLSATAVVAERRLRGF